MAAIQTPSDPARLPASVGTLATVVGWPAALALVEAFPGRSLDLTRGPSGANMAIGAVIGETALRRLVTACAPGSIYVAACVQQARAERDRRIRDQVQEMERRLTTRAAVTAVSRQWHLTDRHIWRILSPANAPAANDETAQQQILPL